jgi:hypothetical protein
MRSTSTIALAFATVAFVWVVGHPIPADQWLGDAPLAVQATAVALIYLIFGWFAAPWIRYLGRQVEAAIVAFREAVRSP